MAYRYNARHGPEHWEALRLSWKCRHIPYASILLGGLLTACVLSAFFSILAAGPSNALP
jgi:hypothetical protein